MQNMFIVSRSRWSCDYLWKIYQHSEAEFRKSSRRLEFKFKFSGKKNHQRALCSAEFSLKSNQFSFESFLQCLADSEKSQLTTLDQDQRAMKTKIIRAHK